MVVLRHAEVPKARRTAIASVRATTVARAILNCAAARLGPALLPQAISDARRAGWLTATETATSATSAPALESCGTPSRQT
jgi:hypothetical protein